MGRLPNNRSFESRSEFFRDGFLLFYRLKYRCFVHNTQDNKQVSKQDSKQDNKQDNKQVNKQVNFLNAVSCGVFSFIAN